MVDDVCDFGIVQQFAELWHRGRIHGATDVLALQPV